MDYLPGSRLNRQRDGQAIAAGKVSNAKHLAAEGFTVFLEEKGYISTYQVAFVAQEEDTAMQACRVLNSANIMGTPLSIPLSNGKSEVIRIVTTEITQLGAEEDEMKGIAYAIRMAFSDPDRAKRHSVELAERLGKKAKA